MPKVLSIIGMLVALLLILISVLDLALTLPFGKASPTMDFGMILAGAILAYLGWNSFRDQR